MRPVESQNKATLACAGPVSPFGTTVLVDAERLDELSALNWRIQRQAEGNRAVRGCPPTMLAERIFGDVPEGFKIGFRNNNKMDCRKSNLVAIPARQRTKRRFRAFMTWGGELRHDKSSSRFTGVSRHSRTMKWRASCFDGKRKVHLGYFPLTPDGEISAARAYDEFARKTFGKSAGLNFPDARMTFVEFVESQFKPEPGAAVSLASITKLFYESDPLASFDNPPDAIRRFLESRFPVATINHETHVGNLTGPGSRIVSDLPLVAAFGQLLPRDLREEEFPHRPGESRPQIETLSRNQMSARGWGKIHFSYAEQMASMKPPE